MGDRRGQQRLGARDRVRASLVELVSGVAPRSGVAVVLEGEAGIGKTSLVRALVAEPSLGRLAVRTGAARELESDLPLAGLADALGVDPIGGTDGHASSSEVGRPHDDAGRTWRVAGEALDALTVAAAAQPTLLILEDVHWLDPTSAVTLARLSRGLRDVPLGLVVTARPDPRPPHVDALLRQLHEDGAHHVMLAPLPPTDVAVLAEATLGGDASPGLLQALSRAGGNPLYVVELLEAYRETGSLRLGDDGWELTGSGTPPSLRLAIVRRLGYLPEETIRVLRLAAVLGPAASPQHLAAVADIDSVALTAALEPAYRGGLLDESAADVAFRHVLIRDALYEDLPNASRRALHSHAAETLARTGAEPAQLAVHLHGGLTAGDQRGAMELLVAARQLVESAPAAAERYATAAAEALPSTHAARLVARTVSVQAAIRLGDADVAETLAHELGNTAVPIDDRLELWRTRIMGRELRGDVRASDVDAYEVAVRDADVDAPIRKRHLATIAALFAWTDPDRSRELLREIGAADEAGPEARALVHNTEAIVSMLVGGIDDAKTSTARALEVLRTSGLLVSWAGVNCLSAYTNARCVYADEAFAADEVLAPVMSAAEISGLRYAAPRLRQAAARSGFFWGEHDAAIDHLETGLAAMDEMGQREIEGSMRSMLGRLLALRGRFEEAEAQVRAISWSWSEFSSDGVMLQAWIDEARGDFDAAWDHSQRSMTALRARGTAGFMFYLWSLTHARLARRLGHADEVARLADELARFDAASGGSAPPIRANALVVRVVAEPSADGVELALRALADAPTFPCRLEGLALVADAQADLGDDDGATAVLREGREVAERCGATAVVARYDAALRERGVRRGAVGRGSRPDKGWDALTEAETRVVDHAVEGLTYREVGERLFISRRTVEAHVRSVFRKLEITSRNELTRAYLERDAAAP